MLRHQRVRLSQDSLQREILAVYNSQSGPPEIKRKSTDSAAWEVSREHRRAQIDLCKNLIKDLNKSNFSPTKIVEFRALLDGRVRREKAALLDDMKENGRGVYKLGNKYYTKQKTADDGDASEYFECDKTGKLLFLEDRRLAEARAASKFAANKEGASFQFPALSVIEAAREKRLVRKPSVSMQLPSVEVQDDINGPGALIGRKIDAAPIYARNLKQPPPRPMRPLSTLSCFFSGDRVAAERFLWGHRGRYLVRELDKEKCVLSFSHKSGRRVDLFINMSDSRVLNIHENKTFKDAIGLLKRMGLSGYEKGLEDTAPPVPRAF